MPHPYVSAGGAGGSIPPGRIGLSLSDSPKLTNSQPESSGAPPSCPPSAGAKRRIPLNSPGGEANSPPKEKQPSSDDGQSPLLADVYPLESDVFSLDATERFPEHLFRMPLPNALLNAMSGLSNSALRAALALYALAHRFDPEADWWVQAKEPLLRADIQAAAGLSEQGTRDGLGELEARGWADVDRSRRSHRYRWAMRALRPHEGGYTYVPTALLDGIGAAQTSDGPAPITSTTELRVVLSILRWTWGFTRRIQADDGGRLRVHDRWQAFSTAGLARYAGCSASAAKRAAKALQGRWIERVRPGHSRYQYRFLPEAVRFGPPGSEGSPAERETPFSGDAPHEIPPDRPSDPPPFIKSLPERLSSSTQHVATVEKREADATCGKRVVRTSSSKSNPPSAGQRTNRSPQPDRSPHGRVRGNRCPGADEREIPPERREWIEKLLNVGVSRYRTEQLLKRYSAGRVKASFEYFRQEHAKGTVRNPGGFLASAIDKGWALPTGDASLGSADTPLPELKEKDTISQAERDRYVKAGHDPGHFKTCGFDEQNNRRFMYLPNGAPRRV